VEAFKGEVNNVRSWFGGSDVVYTKDEVEIAAESKGGE